MGFLPNTRVAPDARRIALAAAAALALSLGATTGLAQPPGGMMHGGPGMHGGGVEQMLPHVLEKARARLNLDTSQQATWDGLVAQGKAAREAARANRQKVKDVVAAELAKAQPDLARIAAAADDVEQQNRAARKALRDQWIAFYTNRFTAEQKAVVRDLLREKIARAEAFRERMRERIREHLGPSAS